MELVQILANIGLPSAIVGMVIIGLLFKKTFRTLSKISVILAIFLAAVFGGIQLTNWIIGKNISITCNPEDFYALSRNGKPGAVEVVIKREDKIIANKIIDVLDEQSFKSRLLVLENPGNPDLEKYLVLYEGNQQGELNYLQMRNMGWKRTHQGGGDLGTPSYWFTHKVFIGQTHILGDTGQYGELKIAFETITKDGKAVVYLILSSREEPIPEKVKIANKNVGYQDFPGLPTFYIAVREADFIVREKNPIAWAAFSIFLIN